VDVWRLPESLSSTDDEKGKAGTHGLWVSPQLLMSQTCGAPLVTELRGKVSVVGTPIYSAEGCIGPTYSSLLVTRRELTPCSLRDFRTATAAINSTNSLSGYTALMAAAASVLDQDQEDHGGKAAAGAPQRVFFSDLVATGGHQSSIQYVADGRADVAAIDCVTFAILQRHRPELLDNIAVFGRTPQLPGLPVICSLNSPYLSSLRSAWAELVSDDRGDSRSARKALLLQGFEPAREEHTIGWYASSMCEIVCGTYEWSPITLATTVCRYEERVGAAISTASTVNGRVERPSDGCDGP
jgi:ABC-type phosphate/phosphonate transport system substrate-binding protein